MMQTMELGQLFSFEPLDADSLAARIADRIDPTWLDRTAFMRISVSEQWRPCDVWEGGLLRPIWTATFSADVPFWSPGGELAASQLCTLSKRQAPVNLAELCADMVGAALVVVYADATRSAYASVWRDRRFRWSLRLDDAVLLARCDGDRVIVEAPPRHIHETDRVGVVMAGLQRFLTEMPALEGVDRLLLPDVLRSLGESGETDCYAKADLFGASRERAVAGK